MTRRDATCRTALALLLTVGLAGCPRSGTERPADSGTGPAKPAADPAIADLPFDESQPADPARLPRRPKEQATTIAVRSILIGYRDARGAVRSRWTREEASRRAQRLARMARQRGVSFLELARKHRSGPRSGRGALRVLGRGQLPAPFDAAAFNLQVGGISDPVLTPSGYQVILREALEEFSSAHILIQYKGANSAPVAITRTKEEARTRAARIQADAVKPGASFAVLASRYSDSPSRIRGGALRPMAPGQMPPEYDNYIGALRQLAVGQVSAVIETPFGFHVIKRLPMEHISASHILIAYNGAEATPREERTKRDAEILARKVYKEASAAGADFAELARRYSDDEHSRDKGGDMGSFARGIMLPRFEQIAFSLKVGQVSDPVDTQMGFHVIKRTE